MRTSLRPASSACRLALAAKALQVGVSGKPGTQPQRYAPQQAAASAYAATGRAQIRAVPPVAGPTRLRCVGIPLAFDGFEALFVQQIVFSEPAPEARPGIGWWSMPARPLFRSHAEAAAWWGAYRCGWVPGRPQTPSWSAFAANANQQADEAIIPNSTPFSAFDAGSANHEERDGTDLRRPRGPCSPTNAPAARPHDLGRGAGPARRRCVG